MPGPLNILQVSTSDGGGGAEHVARNLFRGYRQRGHRSQMAVGFTRGADPDVFVVPNDKASGEWERFWIGVATRVGESRVPGARQTASLAGLVAQPRRDLNRRRGLEDFEFVGTRRIVDLAGHPDLVHCHNLHGGYFDLRALEWLSAHVPVVITMHDAWLLSGHCAHSLACERWRTGCGQCPDLTLYPSIPRDATARNWERKRRIYAASRLHIATPCQWLMDRVEQSMLACGAAATKVIPYGIDLNQFTPTPRAAARAELGLPNDAAVLLFAANGIRRNVWKDYVTMRAAVERVAARPNGQDVIFLALGESGPNERIGGAELRFVPYQSDPAAVARFYSAADLYVHGARADTFPNVVLEALACGTPVVGTAVGGITEQILGVGTLRLIHPLNTHRPEDATGLLVPPGDPEAMARGIEALLSNPVLRGMLSANAVADAHRRFDLERQVNDYLRWYSEILAERHARVASQERVATRSTSVLRS